MFKNIANGASVITNIDEDCVQPNAVDLRVKIIEEFDVDEHSQFVISEDQKTHLPTKVMTAVDYFGDGRLYYKLDTGKAYGVLFDHEIQVHEGEAGFLITRSTLNRNGIFVKSGLYDSGFSNHIGGTIYNMSGAPTYIAENTRIAQYHSTEAETLHTYDGDYNKKEKE